MNTLRFEVTRHLQHTVPAETLLTEVWGPEYAGEVDPGDPKHILTERGFGYRFE